MSDRPFVIAIPWRDPVEAFWSLAEQPHAVLFDGAGEHKASTWSYIAADPIALVETWPEQPGDPLGDARTLLASVGRIDTPTSGLPPFSGGLAGLLSYELGARLDSLPRAPQAPGAARWPDVSLGLYNCIAAFDRTQRRAMIISRDWGGDPRVKANVLAEQLNSPAPTPRQVAWPRPTPAWPQDDYAAKIARTIAYIVAGDCFQANLSQAFDGTFPIDASPFELYARLASRSDAPFSGFWRGQDRAVISNSPERLARLSSVMDESLVTAKPIKGTKPRGATPEGDHALTQALLASEKDRAENLMIVDLLRNDLSRVCMPGSVRVPELFALETFANVHHLVSTISGALRPNLDAFDLISAIFPGGSITGAPKIRAAEIIAELEAEARGPYCGSLAWFGPDGAMDASILIRTIACDFESGRWRSRLRVGGGIVAESTPEGEVQESLDKATAMLAAFGP
ncbi:MAG: anthranilate synthase component I family protein [Caulobacterales bacterium]